MAINHGTRSPATYLGNSSMFKCFLLFESLLTCLLCLTSTSVDIIFVISSAEGHMTGLPRTLSGDLSSLQRRKSESHASSSSPLPPPPPSFPAPIVPDDDRSSLLSGHSSASSNRTGKHWDSKHGSPHLSWNSKLGKRLSQHAHRQHRLFLLRFYESPCLLILHSFLFLTWTKIMQLAPISFINSKHAY